MVSLIHVHLLLNHLPIFMSAIGLLLLLVAGWRSDQALLRIAFAVLVGSALVTILTYMTGEGAAERAEQLPGVPRVLVDAHHDAALVAGIVVILLGGLAFWALRHYQPSIEMPTALVRGVIVGAGVAAALMAYAGFRGGLIRHPEVRPRSMQTVGISTIQQGAST